MTTGIASIVGYAPETKVGPGNPEALKYGKLWERKEYRAVAPGEQFAPVFLDHARPKHGSHVIDFGCGTGRGAAVLANAGMKVTMLDFVRNSLDDDVRSRLGESFTFKKHDLEKPSPVIAEYGYCTDVMEHIPPGKVNLVLENILRGAKHCFFVISTGDDVCGRLIGETLHLSVHPFDWWKERFEERGCTIQWSLETDIHAFFLVSLWEDAQIVVDNGVVNTKDEQIRENVKFNSTQEWQEIEPCLQQETEVMIVGSGPSLKEFEADIRQKRAEGAKLVTLNGAYNWALDHGLVPSATIIVDARETNARFTKPVVDECKYLIASQCHPSVLEGLPKDRTYLWHVQSEITRDLVMGIKDVCWEVPGGSTVLLRAIPLLRMLGYHRFHVYGCDSCLMDGQHHAFEQKENEGEAIIPIVVTGGRIFYCNPWMVAQAREFITLVAKIGEVFDMIVYGDGLLAHIIKTGAEIVPEQEA